MYSDALYAYEGGSEYPFSTVDNCVYFAVRVLYRIRR